MDLHRPVLEPDRTVTEVTDPRGLVEAAKESPSSVWKNPPG
jgi:hypothetical protein